METASKEKIVELLKSGNMSLFNRYVKLYKKINTSFMLDFNGSDFNGSDLSGSNLSGSNLSGSNFSHSNLSGSDLSGSNLSGSNFSHSNLSYSNLSGSNLSGSNLSHSNLSHSNLSGSDLSGSDLSGSDLDFSLWSLSCKTLLVKMPSKLFCQLLYHAAKPEYVDYDKDIKELLNSKLFLKVCNKFHRVKECGKVE